MYMEELLMPLYLDFMNTKDGDDSEGARALDRKWDSLDPLFNEMEKKLSREEFTRVYNVICDTAAQIQTAAFSAGFFYCMKHLIKGGVDFFPHSRIGGLTSPGFQK